MEDKKYEFNEELERYYKKTDELKLADYYCQFEDYFDEGVELFKKLTRKKEYSFWQWNQEKEYYDNLSFTYFKFGAMYWNKNLFKDAAKIWEKGFKVFNIDIYTIYMLFLLVEYYYKENDYAKIKELYLYGLNKKNDSGFLFNNMFSLSLGLFYSKIEINYEEAIKYLDESIGHRELWYDGVYMLVEVYFLSGNYEKFLYNSKRCENERCYYLLGKYYQTVEINYDKAINNYLKYLNFLLSYEKIHLKNYIEYDLKINQERRVREIEAKLETMLSGSTKKTKLIEKISKTESEIIDYYLKDYKSPCILNKENHEYCQIDNKITETRQLILECYKLKDLDSEPAPVLTEFVSLLTDL
jgi:tetratricopeptide (TPR) repeat protein